MNKQKFTVYDIECTSINDKTFVLCGFYDGIKYYSFLSMKAFLDFVLIPRYAAVTFFAHAGGRFDVRYILSEIPYLRKNFYLSFIDISSAIILTLQSKKNKKLKWVFGDSYLLFFSSLKKIGSEMDLEVKKSEHNHNEIFKITNKNIAYNRDDCLTLYLAIKKFLVLLDITKPRLTLAATSLYIFKKKFFNFSVLKVLRTDTEKFVRNSYAGGRVEIFKPYMKNGYCYDFNSLYPSVMIEEMPAGTYVWTKKRNKKKIGFYQVEIFLPYMKIPCTPFKSSKLIFPYGTWEAVLSGIELDLLEKNGGSYIIKNGIEFTKKKKYFKAYVEHFFEIKAKNKIKNPALYYISKLMLNSLYGKFGQRRDTQKIFLLDDEDKKIKKMTGIYNTEMNLYFQDTLTNSKHIKPYISAYITSLARVKLFKLMQDIGYDHVYYCDTDSVYIDKKIDDNVNSDLGGLELEHECNDYHFVLPKFYWGRNLKNDGRRERYVKMKGYDKEIVNNLDDSFIIELSKGRRSITHIKIAGIKECINQNANLIGKGFFKEKIEVKSVVSVYDKRILTDDNSSEPLHIENNTIINLPVQVKKPNYLFSPSEKIKYGISDDIIESSLPKLVSTYELENEYGFDPLWNDEEKRNEIKERKLNIVIKKLSKKEKRYLVLKNYEDYSVL